MSKVARFMLDEHDGESSMQADSHGQYVLHSNYVVVKAERDELARALAKRGYEYISCTDNYHCVVCKCRKGNGHNPGCPVALAERITKEAGDGR